GLVRPPLPRIRRGRRTRTVGHLATLADAFTQAFEGPLRISNRSSSTIMLVRPRSYQPQSRHRACRTPCRIRDVKYSTQTLGSGPPGTVRPHIAVVLLGN